MPVRSRRHDGPKKQEESIAKDIGGKRVKASGALPFRPGDAMSARYLVDAKQTEQKSYALTCKVLEKISKEAASKRRTPLLQVTFLSMPSHSGEWYVISKAEFLDLLERANQ